MIDASVLRALQAAGATTDMIIAAVEADAAIESARREKKRAGNRERQRRFREAHNADNALHDVTERDERDVSPHEVSSSPLSSSEPKGSSENNTLRARKAEPFPRPEWADEAVWRDFLANRKRKRMTNSPTAYRQFLGDLDRLADDEWPPGRLLELAAGKGWGSINRPDQDNRNGHRQYRNDDAASALNRMVIEACGFGGGADQMPQAGGPDFDERGRSEGLGSIGH